MSAGAIALRTPLNDFRGTPSTQSSEGAVVELLNRRASRSVTLNELPAYRNPTEFVEALLFHVSERIEDNSHDETFSVPNFNSILNAVALLYSLPESLPLPEPVIEPDGEVGLLWQGRPHWEIALSVGERGEVHYSALLGPEKDAYGTENINDLSSSPHLRALLHTVLENL